MQQLVLDMNFILKVCEAFISDNASQAANGICEKALKTFFASGKGEGRQLQVLLVLGNDYRRRLGMTKEWHLQCGLWDQISCILASRFS